VVLDIGLRLAGLFNRAAVYTVLTRNTDEGLIEPGSHAPANWKRLDLEGRVELVALHNADLYVSIHANSFPEQVWSGAQTFYYSKSDEAKELAIAIQKELVSRLGPNLRKAKAGDDYFVLRKSTVPAVIVEVGFLSNPREEALLAQADYRRQVAEAVFHGLSIIWWTLTKDAGLKRLMKPGRPLICQANSRTPRMMLLCIHELRPL